MTCDEPKWLDGLVRSSETAGLKLRKDVCMYEVAQLNDFELRINGWTQ
jgi:hypothetical protein